jgi:hypothetical protein
MKEMMAMVDFTRKNTERIHLAIVLGLCEPLKVMNVTWHEIHKQMFIECRRQDGESISLPLLYFKIKEAKDLEKPMMVTKVIHTESLESDSKGRKYQHSSIRYEISPAE